MDIFIDATGGLNTYGVILLSIVLLIIALIAVMLIIIIKFQKSDSKIERTDDKSFEQKHENLIVSEPESAKTVLSVGKSQVSEVGVMVEGPNYNIQSVKKIPENVNETVSEVITESIIERKRIVSKPIVVEKDQEEIKIVEEKTVKIPVKPSIKAKKIEKKPDNWSNFEGAYDGYYYDPEDACYYAGDAPTAVLRQKNADKEKARQEVDKKSGTKKIIKRIAPPSAALDTLKHIRRRPQNIEGFDDSVIYGKYVIENENGEYYFTLYNNNEENLFESKNYISEEYAKKAIERFKTQVLVGKFVVEGSNNNFRFVLTRKGSINEGLFKPTVFEADKNAQAVRYYAQTDVIRAQ